MTGMTAFRHRTPRVFAAFATVGALIALSAHAGTAAAAVGPSGPSSSRTAVPTGSVFDVTPSKVVLNAATGSHFGVFTAKVQAQAGQVRAVVAEIVIDQVSLPASQPNLFVGVTVTCTGPSAKVVLASESGTNVWPGAGNFDIPVVGTFTAGQAGTYTCVTDIKLCDPGNCLASTGEGTVRLGLRTRDPKTYSFLFVSAAVPSWVSARQIPGSKDVLVPKGTSLPMTKTLSLAGSTPPVVVGSVLSVTNCIVPDYPPACDQAKQMQTQGSSTVRLTMTVQQNARVAGAQCTTVTAKPVTEQITWREHHAMLEITVPGFTLSTSAQCKSSVTVTTTLSVLSGNAAAVEGGGKKTWQSVTYAVPPGLAPTL